ncbi:MAG: zinc ribbon domain-containing protein [Kofleriaceae bacterium]
MSCPRCSAGVRASRRYCGQCGCNLAPACQACGFAIDDEDRFCGGCGQGLVARAGEAFATPHGNVAVASGQLAARPSPVGPSPAGSMWSAEELAGLFARPAASDDGPQLPESGVAQDDLDRLFGGAP